jgi:hypothetical protein
VPGAGAAVVGAPWRVSPICGAGRVSPIRGLDDEGRDWVDSSLTTGTPCVLRYEDVAMTATRRRARRDTGVDQVKNAKDLLGRDEENYDGS